MAGPDIVYRADLDDSWVQKKIDRLQKRLDDLGNRGEAGFNKIAASVKAAAVAMGVISGLVTALSGSLQRMADQIIGNMVRSIKAMVSEIANSSEEFRAFSGNLEDFRKDLVEIAGEAFFEQIREDAGTLLRILEEQRGPLSDIAVAFGEIIAAIERGTLGELLDQLEKLDPDTMRDFADSTQRMADALSQLTDREITADLNGLVELFTMLSDTLTTLINIYNKFNEVMDLPVLKEVSEVMSTMLNPLGRIIDGIGKLVEAWHMLNVEMEKFLGFSLVDVVADAAKVTGTPAGGQAGLGSTLPPMARPPIIPPAEEVEEQADKTTDKVKAFYDRLADLERQSARARERVADLIARARDDTIEAGRRRLEIDIANERRRLDNEIKNAEAIEDIWRQHYDALADAARDLGRDEADARRDAARQEIEIERDAAMERLTAETDYRRELQRIRDRFNMAAAEAERNNDAQAFLAAMRQRDQEVVEARRTRDETVQDAVTRAQEQRAALQQQLAFELEDARIANQRKLEDLQVRLQRELEEQAIKAARAEEERQREYARELEDFARKEAERLADLNRSLAQEIQMVRATEATKRQIRVEEARATIAQVQAIMQQIGLREIPYTGSSRNPSSGRRRQAGGPAEAGQPYIVGERGPELFIPDRRGYVVPNAAIGGAVSNVSTVFNQQRSIAPTFNVAEDMFNNPVVMRRLQNLILGVLVEAG